MKKILTLEYVANAERIKYICTDLCTYINTVNYAYNYAFRFSQRH
jgi:hypothetical protein